jgi:hypothetical protein
MSKTNVDTICIDSEDDEEIILFDPTLGSQYVRKYATDLFIPLSTRILYLEQFCKNEPDQFGELISCISGMYGFSRTIALKEYISEISRSENFPIIYRIDCAKQLGEDGYTIIHTLCTHTQFVFLPSPIRVETVIYLMKYRKTEEYKKDARVFFCEIVNDIHIDPLYRFRLIQRLENDFKITDDFYFYANEASQQFVESPYNHIVYRVICCQYIFQKCESHLFPYTNDFLLHTASSPDIDEDIRADACDILLAYGTPENVENARMILFVIGGGERIRNNIFKNSQNVHNHAIESSVETLIEYISTYIPTTIKPYTFEKAKEELEDKIKNQEKYDKTILQQAIIRITIDRAVYGRLHLGLSQIVTKMWNFIQDSPYREELENRLLEELIDSNNKCSSGYVSRIVNTISGFGEMSLQISFEDQIVSVLERRLNAKIMEESDETAEKILDEMTLPVRFYDKRGSFLKFFRTHISAIREDMYKEFKDYITDQDYDLFFRKAIMHYEGVI